MVVDIVSGILTLSGNIILVLIGLLFYGLLIYGAGLFIFNIIFNTKKTFKEAWPVLYPVIGFFGSIYIAIKLIPEEYRFAFIITALIILYLSTFLMKEDSNGK